MKPIVLTDELRAECFPDEASAGCSACEAGVYVGAAALVVIGAVGLASLTVESAVVIAIAEAVGADVEATLIFLKSLAPVLSLGAGAVANRICQWAGAC